MPRWPHRHGTRQARHAFAVVGLASCAAGPSALGRRAAADVASRWGLYSLRWLVRRRLCFRLRVHAEHLPQEVQKEGKCHEDAEDYSIASRLDILSARQRARGSARRLLRVKGRRADHKSKLGVAPGLGWRRHWAPKLVPK